MIYRFSSRRQPHLGRTFLAERLKNARTYDRIAGYFTSSLLEVVGEELESVQGPIRIVCNAQLDPRDVETARAARASIRRAWTSASPEQLLDTPGGDKLQTRYRRLYNLLNSGKMRVRVLPDEVFGLVHGKAGVITLADGSQTSFLGSANETRFAWEKNYELLWEDRSAEAVAWVQAEFDALWGSPFACPLSELVIKDIERLAHRRVIYHFPEWQTEDPAPAVIETPVYRRENGLWEHQKYFVKLAYEAHHGPYQSARFILADQVGLGKTLQLAMTALLIALTCEKPILVIAPKTLLWQWQGELRDLLNMPSAVWNGRQWVDENGLAYPANNVEAVRKCPRRVGIVSSGLISRRSETAEYLLRLEYDCVILDEAHRARRRNVHRPQEKADPNNLLQFMWEISPRTRSLLLATATPIQLHPIEVWDLLDVLARGNEMVLGNMYSPWRDASRALNLLTDPESRPGTLDEMWDWVRNPMPPAGEGRDFEILRRSLDVPEDQAVIPGDALSRLRPPDQSRIQKNFDDLVENHNPLIRHLVRRTREQLEKEFDPETHEPLLQPIGVQLFGEEEREAIPLPAYLQEAYALAEEFCKVFGEGHRGTGFLETMLLRRMGSSIYAGQRTVERILGIPDEEEEFEEDEREDGTPVTSSRLAEQINQQEREILERLLAHLTANQERDPKYERVREYLLTRGWLENRGCIIFSQYRDSIQWLAEQLSADLPDEPIALYSGPQTSGLMQKGQWIPKAREELKQLVSAGKLRLMLGTDAASEGLNLQRLGSLINLDLPWNPTRLEQRKGRIQRIGQVYDTVYVYNMRYKDSVEDRVHTLLSERLQSIYAVFGQLPDVLEDAWVAIAKGKREEALNIIDSVPKVHPFDLRYTSVDKVDWEGCTKVVFDGSKWEILSRGW
ncbi:MAG: helicase SNF2 [Gammaproteobacteria bacterium]|nr:MAG: helicase SNF2 [Gammaproteobacteria bacterium]